MSREIRLIVWTLIRVVTVLLFVGWLILHLRRWDHIFPIGIPASLRLPGAALMCGGGAVVLLTGAFLGTRGILEQRDDRLTPRSLATTGPFQYTRNPMSLGVVGLFAGLGLYCLSPWILLFSGFLFLLLHLLVVYVEEPRLKNHFGEAYQQYEQLTNRWLPTIRSSLFGHSIS
jgi:protein-S-isoprenylcysteine O-methyltransferase Ste14